MQKETLKDSLPDLRVSVELVREGNCDEGPAVKCAKDVEELDLPP